MGYLYLEAPWRGPRGSSDAEDPDRYARKISGYGHLSSWGFTFHSSGTWYVGGASYTGDFVRFMEGSSGEEFLCVRFHVERLGAGFLYWGT
jgi:purine-cytosine permease-like protein